ncbi:MAG TPA: transporter substrate-binding domain-containing protein [Bacteroidetes bacterium]|nr:transporter substrate-binding domain-containing protein [Bacteroidota bacterium]HIL57295.1 transporter substrate-binding domain-containing protein [Rhodothermales bacterium]
MLRGPFRIVAVLLALGIAGAAIVTATAPDAPSVVRLPEPIVRDLDAIVERDTIIALTSYNPTSYFVYRGEAFGYEYDLLRDFAEAADVVVTMRVVPRDSLLYYLNSGLGDVVASRIFPSERDTTDFRYTVPLYETPPTVVQRNGPPGELPNTVDSVLATPPDEFLADLNEDRAQQDEPTLQPIRIGGRRIQRPADLAGEQVFLPSNHAFVQRLVEIENEVTGDIEVVEVDTVSEALVRQVAVGGIDLTVAPENVAALEASYFENLEVRPTIGPAIGVVWAVRKNAPQLEEALDRWILENRDSRRWASLYQKYYVDRDGFRERVESQYLTSQTGTLSEFDEVFKRNAAEIGWDWRLLASQAFQESRFKPRARSWAGAMGLLQIMPLTARDLGISDPYDVEENVDGAVRYLQWLDDTYWGEMIPDSLERQKFILASYNTGAGHVMDAQRLTEKYGGDKTKWDDVAYWLLKKSDPQYYNDPVVRYGYARGLEPVHYVAIILERFDHYRQFVTDEADASEPATPA